MKSSATSPLAPSMSRVDAVPAPLQSGAHVSDFSKLRTNEMRHVARGLKRGGAYYALSLVSLVLLLLLDAGYPGWRIGAVGALLFAPCAAMHLMLRDDKPGALERRRRLMMIAPVLTIVPLSAAMALTGGMSSPLTPLLFVTPIAIFYHGRSRQSLLLLSLLCVSTLVLALIPEAASGPVISRTHAVVIATICLLFTSIRLYMSITVLTDAYRHAGETLWRTREDVLEAATSRGRDLDCIGSKVAHELKNPLAAIKALAQLMAKNAKEDDVKARLCVISGEVTRMESILRDYLSFSRPLGSLRVAPIDLVQLCDDTLAVVEARAVSAGIELRRQGESLALAMVDQQRVKEALLNLLSNAIEATPAGGSVEVEVTPFTDRVEISVRDTGRGIAPENLPRLGSPFFSTREGGTGLGVVLARSIIVQHNGNLSYESTLGQGTTARVSLPRLPV